MGAVLDQEVKRLLSHKGALWCLIIFFLSEQLLWAEQLCAGQSLEASHGQVSLPSAHQLPLVHCLSHSQQFKAVC